MVIAIEWAEEAGRMKWKEIDFGLVGPQIDSLLVAFRNTIEREWPVKWREHSQAQFLVLASLKTSSQFDNNGIGFGESGLIE